MTNLCMAVVTAYTWTGNVTAAGKYPVAGVTVAGPRSVPLGTKVWIEGIGARVVQDRTARRFDGRWDVYMSSRQRCLNFGKQSRRVWVVR